jgi:Domain of unknown function (DUF4252)
MRKLLKLVGLLGTAGVLGFGQSSAQTRQFTTAVAGQYCGQDLKLPAMDALAAKAKEANDISLDPNMLQAASKFVGDKGEDAQIKEIVNGLKSIYVRTFEFEKPGEYTAADYDEFRKQLQDPAWTRVLNSREKTGELTEIYMRRQGDKLCGMALISAEPKELTMISINGDIDPVTIGKLTGKLGIPVPNVKVDQK